VILKQLKITGQCPITGVDLDPETDLVDLQVANSAKPKPLIANNVPGIL
jgi:hypothetical protein